MDQSKTFPNIDSPAPTQLLKSNGGNEDVKFNDLVEGTVSSVLLKLRVTINDAMKATGTTARCVLYKVSPQIRKHIFNAVIDLFFEEHPGTRN
jgi:hypothetical protein